MRRALIAVGLSLALLAVPTSSASAATLSPTSLNFGSQRLFTWSAPQTLTLTKGSETSFHINLVLTDDSLSFDLSSTNCQPYLTDAFPSCTMTFRFKPTRPGVDHGVLYTSATTTVPTATLTGTGVLVGKKCKKGKKRSAQSAKKRCGKKK